MRRRRGCGCLTTTLALVILAAVVLVIDYGGDYVLFAPWAYGWLGQPTLTGGWEGTIRTPGGRPYAVYLQLNRARTRKGRTLNSFGKADIKGQVSWCSRGIRNETSPLFGHANRSASDVVFEAQRFTGLSPGLYPVHFQGAWHGSSLTLHVTFYLSLGPTRGYTSGSGDTERPVPATLHKKGHSAYQAACARI